MNEIASILDQARLFVLQHAPADVLREAVPFGIICLVAGISMSVLGAKLCRFGFVCGFVLLGAYAGVQFARLTGYPAPVCGLVSALLIGVIGYQTFRLWVGVAVAAVLSLAALGVFGYQRVVPHVAEFESTFQGSALAEEGALQSPVPFAVPSPEEQQAYRGRSHQEWARQLWAFVAERDAQVERDGLALGLAVMVAGLCVGLVVARWALILVTSLVGTALVTTALATLLTHSVPESCQAFQQRPALVGLGVGGFLLTSLVLQAMLTRKAPAFNAEPAAKS